MESRKVANPRQNVDTPQPWERLTRKICQILGNLMKS